MHKMRLLLIYCRTFRRKRNVILTNYSVACSRSLSLYPCIFPVVLPLLFDKAYFIATNLCYSCKAKEKTVFFFIPSCSVFFLLYVVSMPTHYQKKNDLVFSMIITFNILRSRSRNQSDLN